MRERWGSRLKAFLMNAFEILVQIALALILLYILWHGYVVVVAYRWKQEDKLISRALAPRDEVP